MHRIASFIALGLILVGCSHPAPPARPMECPVPVATPEPKPEPAPAVRAMDDKAVIARAEAFLRAMDTSDVAAFEAASAKTFVWFLYGRTYDRETMLKRLPFKKSANAPVPVRECKDARIASSE